MTDRRAAAEPPAAPVGTLSFRGTLTFHAHVLPEARRVVVGGHGATLVLVQT